MRHHGAGLLRLTNNKQLVNDLGEGRDARDLSHADVSMLAYARNLTVDASSINESDVLRLRESGFSDRAIMEINLAAAYMNFVNRIAQGLGVFRSFSSSNPTMTVSSTFVTGVVITCNFRSSSSAVGSVAILRSWNEMPFFERNSFVDCQNIQPGCEKSVTFLCFAITQTSALWDTQPSRRLPRPNCHESVTSNFFAYHLQ